MKNRRKMGAERGVRKENRLESGEGEQSANSQWTIDRIDNILHTI